MEPANVAHPDDAQELGRELLGADPAGCGGIVHVVATWREREGRRHALEIRDHTPRSARDFFLLNLARARAEAIVTTGRILRSEGDVVHALQGPGAVPVALARWRLETLGLDRPPILLVLSRGRDLDPEHPAFRADVRPVLFVAATEAKRLEDLFGERAEVVASPSPSVGGAIDWLAGGGHGRITIEAGPSTAAQLYAPPTRIDEIWRSTLLAADLPADLIGPALPETEAFDVRTGGGDFDEGTNDSRSRWRFERLAHSDR